VLDPVEEYHELFESGRRALKVVPEGPLMALCIHRAKDATDPRDKIFALIGMMPQLISTGLIDYSRTTVEVCKEIVHVLVTQTRNLDIICIPSEYGKKEDIPSRAPDWMACYLCSSFKVDGCRYKASGTSYCWNNTVLIPITSATEYGTRSITPKRRMPSH
jgi:hypothetical protein